MINHIGSCLQALKQQNRGNCTNPPTSLCDGCFPWLQSSANLQSVHHEENPMTSESRDTNFSAYVQLWEFTAVEKQSQWWVCSSNQHKKRWNHLSWHSGEMSHTELLWAGSSWLRHRMTDWFFKAVTGESRPEGAPSKRSDMQTLYEPAETAWWGVYHC